VHFFAAARGFGELEEYFLPREIGEITGQAKVPFGDWAAAWDKG